MLAFHGPGTDSNSESMRGVRDGPSQNPGYPGLQAIGSTMALNSAIVTLSAAIEKVDANHQLLVTDIRTILDHRKRQFTEIDRRVESFTEQQQNMGAVLAYLEEKQCETFTALSVFKTSIGELNASVQSLHESLKSLSCACGGRSTAVGASGISAVRPNFLHTLCLTF